MSFPFPYVFYFFVISPIDQVTRCLLKDSAIICWRMKLITYFLSHLNIFVLVIWCCFKIHVIIPYKEKDQCAWRPTASKQRKAWNVLLFISGINFKLLPIIQLRTMHSDKIIIIIKWKLGFGKQQRCSKTREFAIYGWGACLHCSFESEIPIVDSD